MMARVAAAAVNAKGAGVEKAEEDILDVITWSRQGVASLMANIMLLMTLAGVGSGHSSSSVSTHFLMSSTRLRIWNWEIKHILIYLSKKIYINLSNIWINIQSTLFIICDYFENFIMKVYKILLKYETIKYEISTFTYIRFWIKLYFLFTKLTCNFLGWRQGDPRSLFYVHWRQRRRARFAPDRSWWTLVETSNMRSHLRPWTLKWEVKIYCEKQF